jgi:tetraacyldisaccharide 4'-kinase
MTVRRPWALPFVPLYWAALRTKDALRGAGIPRDRALLGPVVSVGSLSAGGAGKTPVVIALAALLRAQGCTVDVLSRGYGRSHREAAEKTALVDLTVPDPASRFGDEPVLIARAVPGVQVWVSADRYAAGLASEQHLPGSPAIHILDDGFQHRRLTRALDIVLLTAEDLDDTLIPASNRREPLSALRRADVLVLREEEHFSIEPRLRRWLDPETPVWTIRRSVELPAGLPAAGLLAFAGIARPQGFFEMLRSCGLRVIDPVSFPDHHRYNAADMRRLAQRMQSQTGGAFITTEKDAVKITPELRSLLEAVAPLHVAGLRIEFTEPGRILAELEARCR